MTRSSLVIMVKRRFRHRKVARFVRTARACLVLGPWRHPLAALHGRRRTRDVLEPGSPVLETASGDLAAISDAVRDRGFARGFRVPPSTCDEVMRFAERRPERRLWNPHHSCQAIDSIARDPQVLDAVAGYLGCRPVLRGTALYWTYPPATEGSRQWSIDSKSRYHFDVGDWRSVNLFTYLTDVEPDCAPHAVVPGTHRPRLRTVLRSLSVPDAEVEARHPGRSVQVLGPRGTAWLEDTVCLHKRSHGDRLRVMLVASYGIRDVPTVQVVDELTWSNDVRRDWEVGLEPS